MFTGIILEKGVFSQISEQNDSIRLQIQCDRILKDLQTGDSISVNGCCLTVESFDSNSFSAYASQETVAKTSLRNQKPGNPVNLEPALTLSTRLGGHLVSGHVDGTGEFVKALQHDQAWEAVINTPEPIVRQSIVKGSIAIDGISLTIASMTDQHMTFWIIPETWERTNLAFLSPGDPVNLETDMIGKYVFRYFDRHHDSGESLSDLLAKGGWAGRSPYS